jgi:hypothetical protein
MTLAGRSALWRSRSLGWWFRESTQPKRQVSYLKTDQPYGRLLR